MAKNKTVIPFTVEEQIPYSTFEKKRVPIHAREGLSALAAEKEPRRKKRAVWIVHGMGQQVPYATLEQLNQGICIGAAAHGMKISGPKFREVKQGTTVLQRVEVTLSKDDVEKEIHLYETYWAPMTEGVVSLKSVIGFLWDGGSRGMINWFTEFHRALFGLVVPFALPFLVPFYLLFTLVVLGALVTINSIILATGASWVGIGDLHVKISAQSILSVTTIAGVAAAEAITFGIVLMLAEMMRPTRPDAEKTENVSVRNVPNARWRAYATLVKWVGWISLVLTAVCIISSAIVMALILFTQYLPGWTLGLEHGRVQLVVNLSIFTAFFLLLVSLVHKRGNAGVGKSPRHGVLRHFLFIGAFLVHLFVPLGVLAVICDQRFRDSLVMVEKIDSCLRGVLGSSLWVWPFLGVLSAMVRKLLVQYVGDVTVYVASTKIDKYDEVRKAIKSLAKQSALAVYSLKATAQQNGHTVEVEDFEYEKVAVVGHSLGSVISYDTLNRLLADDFLADKTHEIDDRTSVFLTFGSPLDKTAFFFSVMGRDTLHVREELASVVQPLIRDPKVRNKIPWVNVYSPSDIICGKLDFYDFPKNLQNEMTKESRDSVSKLPTVNIVENVLDNEAVVPLVAHVEYWQNEMVWNQLVAKLMGVPAI